MKISVKEVKDLVRQALTEQADPESVADLDMDMGMLDAGDPLPYQRKKKEDLTPEESELRTLLIYLAQDGSKTAGMLLRKLMTDKWTPSDQSLAWTFVGEFGPK